MAKKKKGIKTKNVKENKSFWNKLSYWQKGGVIGSVIGILIYILFIVYQYKLAARIGDFRYVKQIATFLLPMILPLILIPTIYGSLYGIFLEKIHSKKKNIKIGLIIVYTIVSAIIFFYIWLYAVVMIAKPY